MCLKLLYLVGGLEHDFYDFPYVRNNNPNWLSYFSEGLKPPTSDYIGRSEKLGDPKNTMGFDTQIV